MIARQCYFDRPCSRVDLCPRSGERNRGRRIFGAIRRAVEILKALSETLEGLSKIGDIDEARGGSMITLLAEISSQNKHSIEQQKCPLILSVRSRIPVMRQHLPFEDGRPSSCERENRILIIANCMQVLSYRETILKHVDTLLD